MLTIEASSVVMKSPRHTSATIGAPPAFLLVATAGPRDGRRDLVEIHAAQGERGRFDPPLDLIGRTCADDRSGDTPPCQRPRDRHGRHGRRMAFGHRVQRVPESDVPLQVRRLEVRRSPPPVVLGHARDARWREALGENAGLHGAVADHPGPMLGTPWDLALAGVATNEREGRLQRIHVMDRLTSPQQ
jgi:hypothetical protein